MAAQSAIITQNAITAELEALRLGLEDTRPGLQIDRFYFLEDQTVVGEKCVTVKCAGGYGYGYHDSCGWLVPVDESIGTLVVDVIDRENEELVLRGVDQSTLEEGSEGDQLEAKVDRAMAEIFALYGEQLAGCPAGFAGRAGRATDRPPGRGGPGTIAHAELGQLGGRFAWSISPRYQSGWMTLESHAPPPLLVALGLAFLLGAAVLAWAASPANLHFTRVDAASVQLTIESRLFGLVPIASERIEGVQSASLVSGRLPDSGASRSHTPDHLIFDTATGQTRHHQTLRLFTTRLSEIRVFLADASRPELRLSSIADTRESVRFIVAQLCVMLLAELGTLLLVLGKRGLFPNPYAGVGPHPSES